MWWTWGYWDSSFLGWKMWYSLPMFWSPNTVYVQNLKKIYLVSLKRYLLETALPMMNEWHKGSICGWCSRYSRSLSANRASRKMWPGIEPNTVLPCWVCCYDFCISLFFFVPLATSQKHRFSSRVFTFWEMQIRLNLLGLAPCRVDRLLAWVYYSTYTLYVSLGVLKYLVHLK